MEVTLNIFEALREDHDKQRTLVDLLVKTKGDSDGRKELLERLKTNAQVHAKAEERFFYKPLIDHDITQDKARHSIAEHQTLDKLFEELETTDFSSPGWLATAKKLQHKLHHHLEEEEHEVFQVAGKALTEDQKQSLATDYQELMAAEA